MRGLLVVPMLLGAAAAAAAPPPGAWWNEEFPRRRPVKLSNGDAAVPEGYSVAITFDHRAHVAASESLASGDDVRVVVWSGARWLELDRVLDTGSAWNAPDTTLWFALYGPLPPSSTQLDHFVYFGNASASRPPSDPGRVFLFWDDFEAGTLDKWAVDPPGSLWSVVTDVAHGGGRSLAYGRQGRSNAVLLARPAVLQPDVYVDAWWRLTGNLAAGMDFALVTRAGGTASRDYLKYNLEDAFGWVIARDVGGNLENLTPRLGRAAVDGWHRIGGSVFGSSARLFYDKVQLAPASGPADAGTRLPAGNAGLFKWDVTGGGWWVDDLVIRHYVEPEPVATLQAAERRPPDGGSEVTDGGATPRARTLGVGCGCGAGPSGPWLLLAALAVRARARDRAAQWATTRKRVARPRLSRATPTRRLERAAVRLRASCAPVPP